jgi:anthranilate synthase component 1
MLVPTKPEFLKLARQGNLIPVYAEILADTETPVSCYEKLRAANKHGTPSFLLESIEGGERVGRYSFVGVNPRIVLRSEGNEVVVVEDGKSRRESFKRDPLETLEKVMRQFQPVPVAGLPRFTGGAVGFLGYEFVHRVEPSVPKPPHDALDTPEMFFVVADTILIFDRAAQTIKIVVNTMVGQASSLSHPRQKRDKQDACPTLAYDRATARIQTILRQLKRPTTKRTLEFQRDISVPKFKSNTTPQRYCAGVEAAQTFIQAGDIIQAVLSQRFETRVKSSALDIFRALRSVNPSPYMFLIETGALPNNPRGLALVGSSPEVHVRCEDGVVEVRPIAGTRPRAKTSDEDLALEKDLLADAKERAEHIMLVDLARNDIGRVCDFGSVHVPELMIIERYSHVMHIVSVVKGNLQRGKTIYDLMRATFPAGTVSGAPKVRAMQIISELERTRRGPYAGAVGYFSFSGNLDSTITIRTVLLKDGKAYVQAGAGVVADSDPKMEFQETVNKAMGMLKAIALAESFNRHKKAQKSQKRREK